MTDKTQFLEAADKLARGLLREAIGYRIEYAIPFYRGIVGYMIQAPMLWIRHSRFPLLFIAYDLQHPDVLADVIKQMEMAKATGYFAVIVVVPTRPGTGNEAEELRQIVANSVYCHDFVVLDRQHLASIIAENSADRLVRIILEQGISLTSLSPYVVNGPVSDAMFFGREEEIKTIAQTAGDGDYAIIGGRQIGKSSILRKLAHLWNADPRYRAISINCESVFTHAHFFKVVSHVVGEAQHASTAPEFHDPLQFYDVIAALQRAHPAQKIVFLIDEIDELIEFDAHAQPPAHLFKVFRALSHEGLCRFIFTGSRVLYGHLHDAKSPFFNFCKGLSLGPLTEKSTAEIISKPMRRLNVNLVDEDAIIDRIIGMTSCHPRLVQSVCDRLLTVIDRPEVTVRAVEEIGQSEAFARYALETVWGSTTPLERLITVVMDVQGTNISDLRQALAKLGIKDTAKIREALDILELFSVVRRSSQQLQFVIANLSRYIRTAEDIQSLTESLVSQAEG
jgi:hypothetical protein